jgi:hypothetical protein
VADLASARASANALAVAAPSAVLSKMHQLFKLMRRA